MIKLTRRGCLFALSGGISAMPTVPSPPEIWRQIARDTDGMVGAAALHVASGRFVSMNGDERFPLASVCKLPIAMNLLSLVDEGKLTLTQEIEVLPRDVVSSVSSIAKRWQGQQRFPLNEMIELMVARSDNTAVETLFRVGGGAPAIAAAFVNGRSTEFAWIEANANAHSIAMESSIIQHPPNGRMESLGR